MHSILVLLFGLCTASLAAKNLRIVGGRPAMPGEFPSVVALKLKMPWVHPDEFECGASILDRRHILTAAHCIDEMRSFQGILMDVIAGDVRHDEKASPSRQKVSIKYSKPHENYTVVNFINDIAVITLAKPLVWTKSVKPTALARELPKPGTKCTVVGWGITQALGNTSDVLQTIEITVLDSQKCFIGKNLAHTKLCVGDETNLKDVCQGDSGGPLYCNGVQAGLVSYGFGCGRLSQAVYEAISAHRKWIGIAIKEKNSFFSYYRKMYNILKNILGVSKTEKSWSCKIENAPVVVLFVLNHFIQFTFKL